VEQLDIHSPFATVLEALRFSAQMRLSANLSHAERESCVQVRVSARMLVRVWVVLVST
jgi:hypothetical protein